MGEGDLQEAWKILVIFQIFSNIFIYYISIYTLPFADVSERFGEVDQILVRESDGGLHQRPVGHSPIT